MKAFTSDYEIMVKVALDANELYRAAKKAGMNPDSAEVFADVGEISILFRTDYDGVVKSAEIPDFLPVDGESE